MPNLKLSQKGILLVALTLLFQFAFVAILAWMLQNAEAQIERERLERETIFQLNQLQGLIDNAGIGLAEQLNQPDPQGTQAFYDSYGKYLKLIPEKLMLVKQLAANQIEVKKVDEFSDTLRQGLRYMERCRKTHKAGELVRQDYMLELQDVSRVAMQQINEVLQSYRNLQQVELASESHSRQTLSGFLAIGLGLDVVIAVLLVTTFTREIAGRIEQVKDNAVRLGLDLPLHPMLGTTDEIGALDKAFHEMAIRLAEAVRHEQAIVHNAVDLICGIEEIKFTFLTVNPACSKFLGFTADEMVGHRCVEFIHADDRTKTLESFQEAIKRKDAEAQFENRLCRKDQSVINASWSVHWSATEHALFCVVHDISQRKEVERLKQDFVAMVSHELRAPLTSMQLVMEMTAMGVYGELSEDGQKKITAAERGVERLIALVNGLLSIEKIESADVELELSNCEAKDVLEPAIHSVHGVASRHPATLRVTEHSNPQLYGDSDRLIQVLVNLLSNAIKFSPQHAIVDVSIVTTLNAVQFEITDQQAWHASCRQAGGPRRKITSACG